jgi:hypothetical protein
MDFTVKGADPDNKLPADAICATCEKKISEHTPAMLHECGLKQQGK